MVQTTSDNVGKYDALKDKLLSHSDDLLMLPTVANEALKLIDDPECTPLEFASVMERDVNLAAEILALSNSAVFAAGKPVLSLHEATVRLGFSQIRSLILASSVASLMKRLPLEQEWIREILWRHSYMTALVCKQLNMRLRLGFQGVEFTAGLLHDFGRLLFAVAAPDDFAAADPLDFDESRDVLAREVGVMGGDHSEFGAWFAEWTGLPESLVASLRYHHCPEVEQPEQQLTALVAAADDIANHLQIHEDPETYDITNNGGIKVLSELIGERVAASFEEHAVAVMEETLQELSAQPGVQS